MPYKFNPFTGKLDTVVNSTEIINSITSEYVDQFIPYSTVKETNFTGKKGQWSWNFDDNTLVFCIASNTWVNLYTLENIKKDNFFKTGTLLDQYVPISKVQTLDSNGEKGQWSWDNTRKLIKYCVAQNTWIELTTLDYLEKNFVSKGELIDSYVYSSKVKDTASYGEKGQWSWNQKDNTLIFCIGSNTWVNLYTLENIKIDNFLKIASLFDNFVPPSLVTSSNASGKKGQWSIQVGHSSHKGYFKFCIATDTWVRFEVETLF